MQSCRICFEDCEDKLSCGCDGHAHPACIRQWIKVRLDRGDALPQAVNCEVCTGKYLGARVIQRCSTGHFAVIMTRVLAVVTVTSGGMFIIVNVLTDSYSPVPVMGIVLIIAFLIFTTIIRTVDQSCIDACAARDVVYLQV